MPMLYCLRPHCRNPIDFDLMLYLFNDCLYCIITSDAPIASKLMIVGGRFSLQISLIECSEVSDYCPFTK